ncbi:hypothetical protein AMAG_00723 [Allomyces macrogynus ATCC 38327]|uniref:Uncharacterized protein n=1 Tax=Allomyces macrogynus (strain ATCC 38327) TaxID=578462 RepID=A0A0L0RWN1_ALLM3|nr:hypothetical protein AMAG_00723 [Allomyces macrogynus ATCC 38327]|eukprot:KNE54768.1 hypothetical protein AMAG_00723 [Allomyces macrogynus ATCC 38327]
MQQQQQQQPQQQTVMPHYDERQWFVSSVYYADYHLVHTPLKDKIAAAKNLRALLATHVSSQDRVILACCILLWPQNADRNVYGLDLAHNDGLAALIEHPQRMSAALASEVGFIVAMLGFYSMQVSRDLGTAFCQWLAESVATNVQFRATVLNMLLAPHHPLPPPPLHPGTAPGAITAPFLPALVQAACDVLPHKLSPPLLAYLLSNHLDTVAPTLLSLVETGSSRENALACFSTCAQSLLRLAVDQILDWLRGELGVDTMASAASIQPFDPLPAKLKYHVSSRVLTLLQLVIAVVQAHPDRLRDHLPAMGPLLTVCMRKAKKATFLVRQLLECVPVKDRVGDNNDWWVALHVDTAHAVVSSKMAMDWADALAKALDAGQPTETALAHLVGSATAPLWQFRVRFAAATGQGTPNNPTDSTMDALDRALVACAKSAHAPFHAGVVRDHLTAATIGGPMTTALAMAQVPSYVARLARCFAAAVAANGDLDATAPVFAGQADVLAVSMDLLESNWGMMTTVLDMLGDVQCAEHTADVLVLIAANSGLAAKPRMAALMALTRGFPDAMHGHEHLDPLVQGILAHWTTEDLTLHLASVLAVATNAALADVSERTRDLIALQLTDAAAAVTKAYLPIAARLPGHLTSTTLHQFKRQVFKSPHNGQFRQPHFAQVVDKDRTEDLPVADMVQIFHMTASFPLPPALATSRDALEFYCAWECARYCILTRFKTPLGTASQTLAALEAFLHKQSKLALHLLDALERWITVAMHPSPLHLLPPIPKASMAFFMANATPIGDWLARLRRYVARYAAQYRWLGLAAKHTLETLHAAIPAPGAANAAQGAAAPGLLARADVPQLALQLVQFGWADTLAGVQAVLPSRDLSVELQLAQGRVEAVRNDENLNHVATSYLLLSDYKGMDAFAKAHQHDGGDHLLVYHYQMLQALAQPDRQCEVMDPFQFATPLARMQAALVEDQPLKCLDVYESVVKDALVPHDTLAMLHWPTNPELDVGRFLKLQRRLGNLKVARAILPQVADVRGKEVEDLKLTLAEGRAVPWKVVEKHPLALARWLIKDRLNVAAVNGSAAEASVKRWLVDPAAKDKNVDHAVSLLVGLSPTQFKYVPSAPDGAVRHLLAAGLCAAPTDAKAWHTVAQFAVHVAGPLGGDQDDGAVELVLRALAQFLALTEHPTTPKAHAAALQLIQTLPHVPVVLDGMDSWSLDETNAHVWEFLVPQVLPLVEHAHPAVRAHAAAVVARVARRVPAACVYPVLVKSIEAAHRHTEDMSPYAPLLDAFEDQDMVEATRVLIHHALKLTVLWEEQWYQMLAHVYAQVAKRHMAVDEAVSFLRAQCDEYLHYPVTEHEARFQSEYADKITRALGDADRAWASVRGKCDADKSTETFRAALKVAWRPLQGLSHALGHVVNQMRTLQLDQVSSLFTDLDLSSVYLPGTDLKMAAMADDVVVLPTKTKPKKLKFTSEQGTTHQYLLKGHEDLHLDRHMMQILRAANAALREAAGKGDLQAAAMLAPSPASPANPNFDVAREYAVVPLGATAGFIQWVDHAVPMYTLYKRAQMAMHLDPATPPTPPPKPLAVFNAAAQKVLGLATVPTTHSVRRQCSVAQLRAIHAHLVATTPAAFLKSELLSIAPTARAYLVGQRRFTHSAAAMSALGFVLGLGDRHLDNVLLDVASGQVVHIDFNVCFDRGASLRVPERVPFRLTRFFTDAMGAVGVLGPFTHAMRAVIKVLRKHDKYFTGLLEPFVLDENREWGIMDVPVAVPGGMAVAAVTKSMMGTAPSTAELSVADDDDVDESVTTMPSQTTTDNGDDGLDGPPPSAAASNGHAHGEDGVDDLGDGLDGLDMNDPIGQSGTTKGDLDLDNVAASGSSVSSSAHRDRALVILAQVHNKINGFLRPDQTEPLSIEDQVDALIAEATDEELLCQMFEGWTAWL